jgi:hypothetical protein
MDWNTMSGDERVRYCTACGKHVHDFAKMTSAEAISLLHDHDWDVCGRLSRRADGTLVTADRGVAADSTRGWQFNIRSLMGLIAGFAATLGVSRLLADYVSGGNTGTPPPRTPISTQIVGKMVRPADCQSRR